MKKSGLESPLQIQQTRQLFIRMQNVSLSVAAMRVSNPDCSLVKIHGWRTAPTPTSLTQIVSDDFSARHPRRLETL
jgi:hypothetical protein